MENPDIEKAPRVGLKKRTEFPPGALKSRRLMMNKDKTSLLRRNTIRGRPNATRAIWLKRQRVPPTHRIVSRL
jgi:hypothetical protein